MRVAYLPNKIRSVYLDIFIDVCYLLFARSQNYTSNNCRGFYGSWTKWECVWHHKMRNKTCNWCYTIKISPKPTEPIISVWMDSFAVLHKMRDATINSRIKIVIVKCTFLGMPLLISQSNTFFFGKSIGLSPCDCTNANSLGIFLFLSLSPSLSLSLTLDALLTQIPRIVFQFQWKFFDKIHSELSWQNAVGVLWEKKTPIDILLQCNSITKRTFQIEFQ